MIKKIVTNNGKKPVKVKKIEQKRKEKKVYKYKNNRNKKRLLASKLALSEIHNNLGEHLLKGIQQTLATHFPDLKDKLDELPDKRYKKTYSMSSIVFAGIMLYSLKQESRHQMNEFRECKKFKQKYERAFKLKLPHLDTVTEVFEVLNPELLEKLTIYFVKKLIAKKIFHRFRLLKKYYTIAIDGTGHSSYEKKPNWDCPYRVSLSKKKKDALPKITWIQPILTAKLVFANGFCIQILTEWIINDTKYEKQDCELKAFKRLAEKLKSYFPRLAICILGDGLYANDSLFQICKEYNWKFIAVFKDKQLKKIQEEVTCFEQLYFKNKSNKSIAISSTNGYNQQFRWINELEYKKKILSWCELNEEEYKIVKNTKYIVKNTKFVFLTNISIDRKTVEEIIAGGRLRWKIENEGFNCQKNEGYELKHKICRTNFNALQNFMHCLQIAHLIGQLLILTQQFQLQIRKYVSTKHAYKRLVAFLLEGEFKEIDFQWNFRYP